MIQELLHLIWTELRGCWRYRWGAMITAWIICIFGWFAVFRMPDIFEARARVFVDADSRLAEVMGEVGVDPGVASRVYIVREAMLGVTQLERVASETGLDLRAETSDEKQALILGLREKVSISSGRTARGRLLYTISFQDRDRDMAVSVVQTLLDTFVEDVLKLKEQGVEDVTGYLEDQLTHYSGLLSGAEQALAEFKKKYVGRLPGESGGIFERLSAEMDQLKMLQSELRIEEDRRDELRRQLRSETPNLPAIADQTGGAPVPGSTAEAAIMELESRRTELLLTFTNRHPDVVAINEQLQLLYQRRAEDRAALAATGDGIEGVANATNPVYQSVQIALNESGVRIAVLRSEITQRESVIRQLNEQINTIPEVEAEYSELTRDYDQYKSLYEELLLRKERERMGTVSEERDVVSFNIIEPPAASLEPIAPKRVFYLMAVLVVGLGAGGTLAFVFHQLNPVFHDVRSLHEIAGQPVLGVVSMTWLEKHRSNRTFDISSFAAAGTSLLIVFVVTVLLREQITGLMHSLSSQVTG